VGRRLRMQRGAVHLNQRLGCIRMAHPYAHSGGGASEMPMIRCAAPAGPAGSGSSEASGGLTLPNNVTSRPSTCRACARACVCVQVVCALSAAQTRRASAAVADHFDLGDAEQNGLDVRAGRVDKQRADLSTTTTAVSLLELRLGPEGHTGAVASRACLIRSLGHFVQPLGRVQNVT